MWIKNSSLDVVVLFFENTTTHSVHLESESSAKFRGFEVAQIFDGQMRLKLPSGTCVLGHQVDLIVAARTAHDEWKFRSRARVLKLESLESDEIEVLLDLHNKNDIDYIRFQELFEHRQNQVFELFKAIKGR